MKQEEGYIALLAVLVVGAIALSIALGLLVGGTDSQRATLVNQASVQARSLATACAEEGLQQIYDLPTFTGTGTLTLGGGNCTYTVTSTGPTTDTIDGIGTVNNVVRKIKVYVTITTNISINSWQESS